MKKKEHRPWGCFTVISEEAESKVKRIEVYAGKRLSYQKHKYRSEHWHVVRGIAMVTMDGKTMTLNPGDSVDIVQGTPHRIENPGSGTLVFIEIQRGNYFGEDDIERIEDDYGRN